MRAVIHGCRSFVDRTGTADTRALTWTYDIERDPLRCIQIKAGQTVCWSGDLDEHPVGADGGDAPSPIDGSGCTTFPAPGDYGYICIVHVEMNGVVRVVP